MRTPLLVISVLFAVAEARQRPRKAGIPAADSPVPHIHDRRAGTAGSTTNELSLHLTGPNLAYTAEFDIGTPPQKLELRIDPSILSVLPSHNNSQMPCGGGGCTQGTYDSSASSSSEAKEKFQAQDANGALLEGQRFTDIWQVGNASIRDVSFITSSGTTNENATVGLGGILKPDNTTRLSLTAAFASAGLATTNAFSLWLSDLAGKTGSLLFGGIDTQKFSGTLTRLKTHPLQHDDTKDGRLGVQLSSVLAVSVTGTDVLAFGTRPLLVEIVLGSSHISLPADLVEAVYREVGATEDPARSGTATIPCHMGNSSAYFSFVFSTPTITPDADTASGGSMINISMSALVLPNDLDAQSVSKDMFNKPHNRTCQFGIVKGETSFALGEAFVRSAYVVFDQENGEIGIAQSNPTPSGSYMIRFPSKGALIPLATPAAQPSGTFPTSVITSSIAPLATYLAAEGFQNYETARPPTEANSTATTDTSPSNGLKVGMGAGFSGGAVAVFTGFMVYWRIVLKRPIPILNRYSKRRWINPHAAELEVKHPQPDVAEAVGFPWAFDRPVGWTELDAPVHPVELEGDHHFHHPVPNRGGTMSSTAVDTEESRSAIAARESMVVPGDLSMAASPIEASRMSFLPGPDRLDIGVLDNLPESFNIFTITPDLAEDTNNSNSNNIAALDCNSDFRFQDGNRIAQSPAEEDCEANETRMLSHMTRPSNDNSPQPPAIPPPAGFGPS